MLKSVELVIILGKPFQWNAAVKQNSICQNLGKRKKSCIRHLTLIKNIKKLMTVLKINEQRKYTKHVDIKFRWLEYTLGKASKMSMTTAYNLQV